MSPYVLNRDCLSVCNSLRFYPAVTDIVGLSVEIASGEYEKRMNRNHKLCIMRQKIQQNLFLRIALIYKMARRNISLDFARQIQYFQPNNVAYIPCFSHHIGTYHISLPNKYMGDETYLVFKFILVNHV